MAFFAIVGMLFFTGLLLFSIGTYLYLVWLSLVVSTAKDFSLFALLFIGFAACAMCSWAWWEIIGSNIHVSFK